MIYERIVGLEHFSFYIDDIIRLTKFLFEKARSHASSPEVFFTITKNLVQLETGFVLIAKDEEKVCGILVGLVVPGKNPWMEIVGISVLPGYFRKGATKGFEIFKAWGASFGASRVVTAATNRPDVIWRLYRQLGFKKIGYVFEEGGK